MIDAINQCQYAKMVLPFLPSCIPDLQRDLPITNHAVNRSKTSHSFNQSASQPVSLSLESFISVSFKWSPSWQKWSISYTSFFIKAAPTVAVDVPRNCPRTYLWPWNSIINCFDWLWGIDCDDNEMSRRVRGWVMIHLWTMDVFPTPVTTMSSFKPIANCHDNNS